MVSDLRNTPRQQPEPATQIIVDTSTAVPPPPLSVNDNNQEQIKNEDAVVAQQQRHHEALRALVSERFVVEWTPEQDEMVDPLERAIRFVLPIPKHYYWDVVSDETDWAVIPIHIKVWHRLMAGSVAVGEWTNHHVAQPVASALGLTASRFYFVTDQMSLPEMEQSRRMVQERKRRNQELQQMRSAGNEGGDAV